MRRTIRLALLGCLAAGAVQAGPPAAAPGPAAGPAAEARRTLLLAERMAAPRLTDQLEEIKAALDSSRAAERALQAVLAAAEAQDDQAAAAAARRQLQELDLQTRLQILEIQHRHAVRQGRDGLAGRIAASLEALRRGAPVAAERAP